MEEKSTIITGIKLGITQGFDTNGVRWPITKIQLADTNAADLKGGDLVKATGWSKGKGFSGVVKRWRFKGGPKTHGQSDRQRAPGSIGQTTTPGRVYKGKRMAGHTGKKRITISGLTVMDYQKESKVALIRGIIPGANKGKVLIRKYGMNKKFIPLLGLDKTN